MFHCSTENLFSFWEWYLFNCEGSYLMNYFSLFKFNSKATQVPDERHSVEFSLHHGFKWWRWQERLWGEVINNRTFIRMMTMRMMITIMTLTMTSMMMKITPCILVICCWIRVASCLHQPFNRNVLNLGKYYHFTWINGLFVCFFCSVVVWVLVAGGLLCSAVLWRLSIGLSRKTKQSHCCWTSCGALQRKELLTELIMMTF